MSDPGSGVCPSMGNLVLGSQASTKSQSCQVWAPVTATEDAATYLASSGTGEKVEDFAPSGSRGSPGGAGELWGPSTDA